MHGCAIVSIFRVIIHRRAFKILQRCGGNSVRRGKSWSGLQLQQTALLWEDLELWSFRRFIIGAKGLGLYTTASFIGCRLLLRRGRDIGLIGFLWPRQFLEVDSSASCQQSTLPGAGGMSGRWKSDLGGTHYLLEWKTLDVSEPWPFKRIFNINILLELIQ